MVFCMKCKALFRGDTAWEVHSTPMMHSSILPKMPCERKQKSSFCWPNSTKFRKKNIQSTPRR